MLFANPEDRFSRVEAHIIFDTDPVDVGVTRKLADINHICLEELILVQFIVTFGHKLSELSQNLLGCTIHVYPELLHKWPSYSRIKLGGD